MWLNVPLKYTDSCDAVAVPVNEMDARGNPVLLAHGIPIKAKRRGSRRDSFGGIEPHRIHSNTSLE